MNEGFGSRLKGFLGGKKHEPEHKIVKFDDLHDQHTDEVFKMLQHLHKKTHPEGNWQTMRSKQRKSTAKIQQLHDDVNALIKKHGERKISF
jgi:hypothetical protein